jgi:hypothetical protein
MAKLVPREKYKVIPGAYGDGDNCHVHIEVEFERADGTKDRNYALLPNRGSYRTMQDATIAAQSVEVESVAENGVIVFVPAKG